jgi:drug/metabolite transporter (DMT)-like permease
MALWLPVALIAPFCYAMEGNLVAKLGTQGMGPGHTLFGASVAAMLISLPLALGSGQFIDPRGLDFGLAEWALAVSASVNVLVYSGYVWLVGRSGAVFASQIAYVVTGSGVVWAMVLLGESYSAFVWLALVLILGGVFLVQPRHKRPMVAEAPAGQGGPAAQ